MIADFGMQNAEMRQVLTSGAQELGISLRSDQIDSLYLFLAELKKWNRKINLTAITEERDVVIKHVLDSLSFTKGFIPAERLRLLDMGSGAGFPAVPIKIVYPGIAVALVESVKKKASFLRHVIRTLSLKNTEVLDSRTDEIPDSRNGTFDVVTARAFADIAAAITSGMRFLKPGGLMILSRGPEETVRDKALEAAGCVLKNRLELVLPHSDYKRVIWAFERITK